MSLHAFHFRIVFNNSYCFLVLAFVLSALHAPYPLILTITPLERDYDPPFLDEKWGFGVKFFTFNCMNYFFGMLRKHYRVFSPSWCLFFTQQLTWSFKNENMIICLICSKSSSVPTISHTDFLVTWAYQFVPTLGPLHFLFLYLDAFLSHGPMTDSLIHSGRMKHHWLRKAFPAHSCKNPSLSPFVTYWPLTVHLLFFIALISPSRFIYLSPPIGVSSMRSATLSYHCFIPKA